MSDPYRDDFNRPDLNRPDLSRSDLRPVVAEEEGSGMAMFAGIALAALLIVGGFLFFTYSGPTTVASNDTAPITRPAPTIAPGQPMTPPAPAPMAAPPASTPAQ